jgi:hypothetical protein
MFLNPMSFVSYSLVASILLCMKPHVFGPICVIGAGCDAIDGFIAFV